MAYPYRAPRIDEGLYQAALPALLTAPVPPAPEADVDAAADAAAQPSSIVDEPGKPKPKGRRGQPKGRCCHSLIRRKLLQCDTRARVAFLTLTVASHRLLHSAAAAATAVASLAASVAAA